MWDKCLHVGCQAQPIKGLVCSQISQVHAAYFAFLAKNAPNPSFLTRFSPKLVKCINRISMHKAWSRACYRPTNDVGVGATCRRFDHIIIYNWPIIKHNRGLINPKWYDTKKRRKTGVKKVVTIPVLPKIGLRLAMTYPALKRSGVVWGSLWGVFGVREG